MGAVTNKKPAPTLTLCNDLLPEIWTRYVKERIEHTAKILSLLPKLPPAPPPSRAELRRQADYRRRYKKAQASCARLGLAHLFDPEDDDD